MRFTAQSLENWGPSSSGNFTLDAVRGKQLRCTLVLLHQEPAYQLVCDSDPSIVSRPMHAGAAWLLCQALNSMPFEPASTVVSPEEYEYDYVLYCLEKRREAEDALRELERDVWKSAGTVGAYSSHPAVVSGVAAFKVASGALAAALHQFEAVTGHSFRSV